MGLFPLLLIPLLTNTYLKKRNQADGLYDLFVGEGGLFCFVLFLQGWKEGLGQRFLYNWFGLMPIKNLHWENEFSRNFQTIKGKSFLCNYNIYMSMVTESTGRIYSPDKKCVIKWVFCVLYFAMLSFHTYIIVVYFSCAFF